MAELDSFGINVGFLSTTIAVPSSTKTKEVTPQKTKSAYSDLAVSDRVPKIFAISRVDNISTWNSKITHYRPATLAAGMESGFSGSITKYIKGRVLDRNNLPLSRKVRAFTYKGTQLAGEATSGEDGYFTMFVCFSGPLFVIAIPDDNDHRNAVVHYGVVPSDEP